MLDTGSQEVLVPFTVDECTFIIAGLRDLADAAEKRSRWWFIHSDDRELEREITNENRQLADYIEKVYTQALGG